MDLNIWDYPYSMKNYQGFHLRPVPALKLRYWQLFFQKTKILVSRFYWLYMLGISNYSCFFVDRLGQFLQKVVSTDQGMTFLMNRKKDRLKWILSQICILILCCLWAKKIWSLFFINQIQLWRFNSFHKIPKPRKGILFHKVKSWCFLVIKN